MHVPAQPGPPALAKTSNTMNKIASATLLRPQNHPRQCSIELIELDLPASVRTDPEARFVVTVRQGELTGGVLLAPAESTLTAVPVRHDEALRRARDFIQRRQGMGDVLTGQQGFENLPVATQADTWPGARPAASAPSHGDATVPPAVAALVARFHPDRWRLLSPAHRSRTVWRVAERSDPDVPGPGQQALVALVPRLIALLETGDDLLDHGIAVAVARLGDTGAAEAMHHLARRGRAPFTRRAAHQAWLLLQSAEARATHAAQLLPDWQADLLHQAVGVDDLPAWTQALADRQTSWPRLLMDWYDIALVHPQAHARLRELLRVLPLQPGSFQAVRFLYKAAEVRRDAAVLGVLHARFENTPAYFNGQLGANGFVDPATRRWVRTPPPKEMSRPDSRLAYCRLSRDYLRLRGWRQLRRLAELGHSHAPVLAVDLLLGLDDSALPEARQEHRYSGAHGRWVDLHYSPSAGWLLAYHLLLATHPDVHMGARAQRWHSLRPIDTNVAVAQRTDGLRSLWDAHPQALLALALRSRAAIVHAVVARALQDHLPFLGAQDPATLQALLRSRYAPTSAIGFAAVRARLEAGCSETEQVAWIALLVHSTDPSARDFALLRIASDPLLYARHAGLVARLLASPHAALHRQGAGLATLADAPALLAELQNELLALDAEADGLADSLAGIVTLLQGTLAPAARQAPVEPLLCLLTHAHPALVNLAARWLVLHAHGASLVPPEQLARLLAEEAPERRAAGVTLLAALPDRVLLTQAALMGELAVHPHALIRNAVAPALERLSQHDSPFARALAERLHAALFAAEAGEGVHADALRWLTGWLRLHAPGRDAASLWRALQARSAGAQRYGAWGLTDLPPSTFSLRQQALLARHADATVRAWSLRALDATLGSSPSPEQATQLLPLADSLFDDARAYAHRLFAERLPDAALRTELLIAWIDHPQAWVQALGRARLVRRMDASEASLCLTRLSQHPSPAVQLFVTQWLLEMPRDDLPALADRLRALTPYLVTVLSQVHRGRTAKTRITAFLRSLTEHAETAAVVAGIFARQVVTASRTDKPQYIAGLRDIAARHPHIDLPFVDWKPVEYRAGETA